MKFLISLIQFHRSCHGLNICTCELHLGEFFQSFKVLGHKLIKRRKRNIIERFSQCNFSFDNTYYNISIYTYIIWPSKKKKRTSLYNSTASLQKSCFEYPDFLNLAMAYALLSCQLKNEKYAFSIRAPMTYQTFIITLYMSQSYSPHAHIHQII